MIQNNFTSNPSQAKLTNMSRRPRNTSGPQPETQWDHIRTRKRPHTHIRTHTPPHMLDKGVETCDFVIDTKKPLIGTLTLLMLWQISPKDPRRRAAARVDMRPAVRGPWHTHTHWEKWVSGTFKQYNWIKCLYLQRVVERFAVYISIWMCAAVIGYAKLIKRRRRVQRNQCHIMP